MKIICTTCKGNGFLKVGTEYGETVHQCWDCESTGEIKYEDDDATWNYIPADTLH